MPSSLQRCSSRRSPSTQPAAAQLDPQDLAKQIETMRAQLDKLQAQQDQLAASARKL